MVRIILRSALFWDSTLRDKPAERKSHLHRGASLKSCTCMTLPHHFRRCSVSARYTVVQGGSNMTGADLCVNKPQSVPVIFEPPCITSYLYRKSRQECAALCHCTTHSTPSTWTIPQWHSKQHETRTALQYFMRVAIRTAQKQINVFFKFPWQCVGASCQSDNSHQLTYLPRAVTPEKVQQPTGSSRAQLLCVHCGNCFFQDRRWKCKVPLPVD